MSNLRVVNFHGIGTPKRELEPGEAPYWISVDRYRFMLDRIAAHPDRANIVITFDDGNISDLEIGAPELLARDLKAAFFVLTGRLDQPGSLSATGTRALLSAGMSIGSHGIDHLDWSGLANEALRDELVRSKDMLEGICGQSIRFAAIPFGRYNAAVIAAARMAGYEGLYSSDGGAMNPSAFLRPRSSVRADTGDATFSDILDGRVSLTRRLRRAAVIRLKHIV